MKHLLFFVLCVALCGPAVAQQDTLYAVVLGDTVDIWNTGVEDNCAREFAFDMTVAADSLYVVERDTAGMLAFCTCTFNLRVTVTGLGAGAYTAVVYRRYTLPYDTVFLVGTTTFVITGPPVAFSRSGYQSECLGSAVDPGGLSVPGGFRLEQNYPNPFNPSTEIGFQISDFGPVELSVFDVLGRKVATLVREQKPPGIYTVRWDASGMGSGIYLCRLRAGGQAHTRKLVVAR